MAKEKTTKNVKKWDNVQKIGFWGLIIVSIAFWSGVYIGNIGATTAQKELEQAKTSAIEEYKATQVELKTSEQ